MELAKFKVDFDSKFEELNSSLCLNCIGLFSISKEGSRCKKFGNINFSSKKRTNKKCLVNHVNQDLSSSILECFYTGFEAKNTNGMYNATSLLKEEAKSNTEDTELCEDDETDNISDINGYSAVYNLCRNYVHERQRYKFFNWKFAKIMMHMQDFPDVLAASCNLQKDWSQIQSNCVPRKYKQKRENLRCQIERKKANIQKRLQKRGIERNFNLRSPDSQTNTMHISNTNGSKTKSLEGELMNIQYRELTPEDYDLLISLDDCIPKKVLSIQAVKKIDSRKFEKDNERSSDSCCICLEQFLLNDMVKQLPSCGHVFHEFCINTWLQNSSDRCPIDSEQIVV